MTSKALAQPDMQARLRTYADGLAAAVVVSLPWSTSATNVLIVLWLVALIPTLRWEDLREVMRKPAAWIPVALVLLGAAGMLWADIAWAERTRAMSPYFKLLALPLLFVQFRRSPNGHWVLGGFLVSCTVLLLISTAGYLTPNSALWSWFKMRGVPVKDYLMQAALFVVSAFILFYFAHDACRTRRWGIAAACGALAIAFIANIAFVASSRTALLTVPVLLVLFALKCFRWKGICIVATAGIVAASALWLSSDYMRQRLGNLSSEITAYETRNIRTSAGERLEFWKKSVGFVAEAPVLGHGTGSTRSLFARVASGGDGVSSLISTNPHNQFLAVAVQLGLFGGLVLVAMWIAHAMLFRGPGLVAWIGLLFVAQNVFGSLFNSHIFDFGQGWLYVFGVGVAGGLMMAKPDDVKQPAKPPLEAIAHA